MINTEEEIKKEMMIIFEPQKKLFEEMIGECNGKVMDYKTCKLFEDFFEEYTFKMIDNFIESLKQLKIKKQR